MVIPTAIVRDGDRILVHGSTGSRWMRSLAEGAPTSLAVTAKNEALLPGPAAEVRASTPKELAATMVLSMPIERWSLKISDGWPEDPAEDVDGSAWAGVITARIAYDAPRPAPDLRPGIDRPDSVHRFTKAGSPKPAEAKPVDQ